MTLKPADSEHGLSASLAVSSKQITPGMNASHPDRSMLARAYIGLGANLGAARATLMQAAERLAGLPQSRLVACSSHYGSAPVGYADQPDFINAVIALDTGLGPLELLHALQSIETAQGRVRSFRNAPRTLDLDLLLHGETRADSAELTLPHPRLHERAFVLLPLHEIAPELSLPGVGPIAQALERVAGQRIRRLDT